MCEPSPSAPESKASASGSPSSSPSSPSSSSSGTPSASGSSPPATPGSPSAATSSWQPSLFGSSDSETPPMATSTSSRRASPANRGQRRGSGSGPRTTAGSGPSSRSGFAWYDRATSSWRTSQGSLVEGLDTYSETWPRWGTMRRGECFPARPWEPATAGSECSSWQSSEPLGSARPTPVASDQKSGAVGDYGNSRPLRDEALKWGTPTAQDAYPSNGLSGDDTSLPLRVQAARMADPWPTPKACVDKMGLPRENDRGDIQAAALGWPTPTTNNRNHPNNRTGKCLEELATELLPWPTPTAGSYGTNPPGCASLVGPVRPSLETLARGAEWATPPPVWPRPTFLGVSLPHWLLWTNLIWEPLRLTSLTLAEALAVAVLTVPVECFPHGRFGPQDETSIGDASTQDSGRRLNPLFVEWLMGAPIGWSDPSINLDCEPWATACRLLLAPLLGACCPPHWRAH